MNRRKFLKNGAMAIVAASVAPAAVLSAPEFASGGIVPSGTYFVGEYVCELTIPREQMERLKAMLKNPDYYSRPLLNYSYYLIPQGGSV